MLLNISLQLSLVRFPHLIHNVIVFLVVFNLLSELLRPLLELLLNVHNFQLKVVYFQLIVLLDLRLSLLNSILVLFKLLLSIFLLLSMFLFQVFDHLLEVASLLLLLDRVFLTVYDIVSLFEDDLNFFLIGSTEGILVLRVFFVLRVEVEDDLGELGYLLGHLVVSVLAYRRCTACCCHFF